MSDPIEEIFNAIVLILESGKDENDPTFKALGTALCNIVLPEAFEQAKNNLAKENTEK